MHNVKVGGGKESKKERIKKTKKVKEIVERR